MRAVPIAAARRLGQESGARRIVVIAVSGDDYCITTWGQTRRECAALAAWAESDDGSKLVAGIGGTRPKSGAVLVANEPAADLP